MKEGDIIAGQYELRAPLGEGGIGIVWEAWQRGVDRPVALKFLKPVSGTEERRRFDVEARALGRLNHQHCVTVHDFGKTEAGEDYLVMEYLEGVCASAWRGQQLRLHDVVEFGRHVSAALAYAHHQGVVHRDLKLENVFCVETFEGGRCLKVLDFGLAKLTGRKPSDLTRSGVVFGTPAYMSPEQLRGTKDAGPASDLYSLGVMLYELIEGQLPFPGATILEIGSAHLFNPVPPILREDVPPELTELVTQLLSKEPSGRPESALEVYAALGKVKTSPDESSIGLTISRARNPTEPELPEAFVPTIQDAPDLAWDEVATEEEVDKEALPARVGSDIGSRAPIIVAIAVCLLGIGVAWAFWGSSDTQTPPLAAPEPPAIEAEPPSVAVEPPTTEDDLAAAKVEPPSLPAGSTAVDEGEPAADLTDPPEEDAEAESELPAATDDLPNAASESAKPPVSKRRRPRRSTSRKASQDAPQDRAPSVADKSALELLEVSE